MGDKEILEDLRFEEFRRLYWLNSRGIAPEDDFVSVNSLSSFSKERRQRWEEEIKDQWNMLSKGIKDWRISDSGLVAWSEVQRMSFGNMLDKKVEEFFNDIER